MSYHSPVLLTESVEGLNICPDGVYLDLTYGGGGHSLEILKALSPKGRLLGFDQDLDALNRAIADTRFIGVHSNFRFFKNFLRYHKIGEVNGILADLGVSSHHFDSPDRGFSFRFDGPLDMRMNRELTVTAANIINEYSKDQLINIFKNYGELDNPKEVATAILKRRDKGSIGSIKELVDAIRPVLPEKILNKSLAKVFQALRIEVNQEMRALMQMLERTPEVLSKGGRLVIISYHSLEDRMVKSFLKTGAFDGEQRKDFFGNTISPFKQINRKVITPSEEEITINPRARSAKLRIGERI